MMLSPKASKLAAHVIGKNSAIRSAVPENNTLEPNMDRTTGCGDMAIWNLSKVAAAAILDFFEPKIAPLDPPSQKTQP